MKAQTLPKPSVLLGATTWGEYNKKPSRSFLISISSLK